MICLQEDEANHEFAEGSLPTAAKRQRLSRTVLQVSCIDLGLSACIKLHCLLLLPESMHTLTLIRLPGPAECLVSCCQSIAGRKHPHLCASMQTCSTY